MTVAGGKWKHYLAIGEEAARGTAEKTTVGFIPLNEPFMPKPEYHRSAACIRKTKQPASAVLNRFK